MTVSSDIPLPRSRWLIAAGLAIVAALVAGIWAGPALKRGWDRLFPTAAQAGDGETWYISQMHPWIIQNEPGQCPICGMDLTPIDPKRFAAELSIDPVTIQNIGVRTVPVVEAEVVRGVRTVGTVRWDPGRSHRLEVQAMGWVRALGVRAAGDPIRAGQVLAEVESPELIAAQREYLAAAGLGASAQQAVLAKLAALGLPDAERDVLVSAGTVHERIALRATGDGLVTRKMVEVGDRVGPGMPILAWTDPSTVWIDLALYENQVDGLAVGDTAHVEVLGGGTLEATLAYLEPTIDPMTRSLTVRLVCPNPEGSLREGAFVTATIAREPRQALVIPREAVRRDGEQHRVFVQRTRGRFEPRVVEVGAIDDQGRQVVTAGLAAGEQVVVSGQFLLDSEARVKEAIARMIGGGTAPVPTAPPPSADPAAAAPAEAGPVVEAVLAGHAAAQGDDLAAWRASATDLLRALDAWQTADAHVHHKHPPIADLRTAAETLATAADVAAARQAYGRIGVAVRDLLREIGRPAGTSLHLFRCGMVDVAEDGWWIQADDDTRNPYDDTMRTCGSEEPW